MEPTRTMVAAVLMVGISSSVAHAEGARLHDVKRVDLLKHDISIPGRQVIQVLVEFGPGMTAPNHSHPGEEIVYVVKGSLEYRLERQPPITLKAGDTLFIPDGKVHAVRNVGDGAAAELATYIVKTDEPLIELSK
ncbi:cupin domain-containing protein [Mesorhizobium opportunistum]|uniref:cupin domain-containing protein n=1 Tax=Mesorhizobium opportunistum TaxID=593909 RepID=UPI00333CE276